MAGVPERACNKCGCCGFDRIRNGCHEYGADISERQIAQFEAAREAFQHRSEQRQQH